MSYESEAIAALKKIDQKFKSLEDRIRDLEGYRETLVAYGEIPKEEYKYLAALHRGEKSMFEILKTQIPSFDALYEEQAGRVFGQEYPGTSERIQQLDELLQKLKNA